MYNCTKLLLTLLSIGFAGTVAAQQTDTLIFSFEDSYKKNKVFGPQLEERTATDPGTVLYALVVDENSNARAEGMITISGEFYGIEKLYDKTGNLDEVRHYGITESGVMAEIGTWYKHKKGVLNDSILYTHHPVHVLDCSNWADTVFYRVYVNPTLPKWLTKKDSKKLNDAYRDGNVYQHTEASYDALGKLIWQENKYTGNETPNRTPYLGFEGSIYNASGIIMFDYQFCYLETEDETKYTYYENGFADKIVYYATLDETRTEWTKILETR